MKKNKLEEKDIVKIYERIINKDDSFKPDKWQREILEYKGNIVARCGRQVGKSSITGKKATMLGLEHAGITILMIGAAQRQSSELFEKTQAELLKVNDEMLEAVGTYKYKKSISSRQNEERRKKHNLKYGVFKRMPTKTEMLLNNGTRILSLPTGKTGAYIRCFTIDILIADEAAYIPEPVWVAVKPMLAVSQKMRGLGYEILISTPFGKGGYFYNCCFDKDFKQFHIKSEDCRRISRKLLTKEKQRLSKREYAQEYDAVFIDEFNQFFPSDLIKDRMSFISWNRKEMYDKEKKYYLGLDIARYGQDENAFVVAEMDRKGYIKIVDCFTTMRKSLTDTAGRAIKLHEKWNFAKIFTDDNGVGAGVTDMLIEQLGKSKVHGVNSSKKSDVDKIKRIMKEDLYSNALVMMEKKRIDIISHLGLERSLKSMTFKYNQEGNVKIYGNYSHLAEAFVRACWCNKAKGLRLFVA